MEARRTILALVISFAILMGWQIMFPPPLPPEPVEATDTASVPGVDESAQPGQAQQGGQEIGASTPAGAPTALVEEQITVLSNELVSLTLTNWGAKITAAELARYNDIAGPEGKPLVLLPDPMDVAGATSFEGAGLSRLTPFNVVSSDAKSVKYSWTSPTGMTVKKTFTLRDDSYVVDAQVAVLNNTGGPMLGRVAMTVSQGYGGTSGMMVDYIFKGPSYYKDGSLEEVDLDDAIESGVTAAGNLSWVGTVEKYFMSAMMPDASADAEVRINAAQGRANAVDVNLMSPTLNLAPGAVGGMKAKLFIGPKAKDVVATVGSDLDKALDYGWFSAIARPMVVALDMLYGVFGNYGIAIIILTTFIKLLFWPLSAKSYKSMARMRELQPKIQKLKERCGDDKEELNRQTMQLWKTHKVNPASGCLPIFLQIPVFIALYRALMSAIELRHAPFFGWLVDLSAKDPYYVTPILMGASMFVQQKLTPSTGASEGQMKFMMYGMPLVFTWMFLDFPSGLVIYWLWNNILSVGQQASMMRKKTA